MHELVCGKKKTENLISYQTLIFSNPGTILDLMSESKKKSPREKTQEMLEEVDTIRLLKALLDEPVEDKEDKEKRPKKKEK